MKVKDLIEQEICVDVYDDVCEELAIAFDGPVKLTEAGAKKFGEVLNYDVALVDSGACVTNAIVHIDDEDDKVWERRLRKAKEFFEGMAGYCAADDYDKWFKEV